MRVLVPYDGSDLSEKAVEHAIERYDDAEIVLLYVLDFVGAGYDAPPEASLPGYWADWYEDAESSGREMLEAVRQRYDANVETETVLGRPARAIVEYAEDNDVDAVVMGSHGREGVSRVLLGSVAETVVRRSPIPVTVVR
ncbi:universal stress protein [Natronomonas marina]|jgi:nucleotide-binding universal stress UspA family protein|uniref:universal stress protein n=1 Tax=Natronomonas marina TaxID=2961939 RepID=UPI0020C99866|nr:universal stress protein [Natronomonas marina]